MTYNTRLLFKIRMTLINGALSALERLSQRPAPTPPTAGFDKQKVYREFREAVDDLAKAIAQPPNFKVQDKHVNPSPAFEILAIEKEERRIHFETRYPNVAEDRLGGFGDIQRIAFEGRPGKDVKGATQDYVFYRGCLNVSDAFEFQRAIERAVGLENMDLEDVLSNATQLLKQSDMEDQRDYTNDLYSKLEVQIIMDAHALVIVTALQDFPLRVDPKICQLRLNEAASSDGFMRRYHFEINPEVNVRFAASYCYEILKTIAKETVTQGAVWDVWKNGESTPN